MAADLAVYQFPVTGQTIRTLQRDGDALVCLADICRELQHSNPSVARRLVDEEDLILVDFRETDSPSLNRTSIEPRMWFVTEAGFYTLAIESKAPRAKGFRRWITHEVLPAIRKTGGYGRTAIPDMGTPEGRLQILDMAMRAERRALESEQRIKELEPEAARARQTIDADGLSLVGTVAKRFGIKERALRQFLYGEGILIEGGTRRNEPMARYVQSGHFELKTRPVEIDPDGPPTMKSTTYVTPKGEALIWKRLFDAGLVRSPEMPSQQLELLSA